jgi:SAM-dependent methyltransferase
MKAAPEWYYLHTLAMPERPEDRFKPVAESGVFKRIRSHFGLSHKKVLDLGCAYGEHLVHFGPGSLGITTTSAEVAYGKEHKLPIIQGNVERLGDIHLSERFDAFWANNLFEHLLAPHAFLIEMKRYAGPDAILILGVPVLPRIASLVRLRRFRGALAVAHINFFTRETLRLTIERAGWRVQAVRPFVGSIAWLDTLLGFLSPHLYVIATNDAHFRYPEKKLKEWEDDDLYLDMLAVAGPQATTASVSSFARVV